ncbi:EAL domain-containing protein, partial [Sinorhizobium meliloti]|uniref:EAL domain-containing protein n=1 Tax=Rhizobium meliloti TaxID=382 RepID=UPI000FD55CA7
SQAIVRAIVALAQGLGMRVTAEGVETAAQAAWLRKLRCDRLQGNLLGAATPPDSIRNFLRQSSMASQRSALEDF